jgi:nucleoside-diphosphate-sugar epimerase
LKILITGHNGFLGSYIKNHLDKNNEVYTLSRSDKSNYKCSIEKQIPTFNENFEIVIHAAGKAHAISNNNFLKDDFFKINVIGVQNLLKGLVKKRPHRFIFISTVSVYGSYEGENIDESSQLLANDPYGKSKIEAEVIVKKWCDDYNVICTILRLPLVIGANPPGNLGTMIRGIKKGYYFNIAGGNAKKSMVLATDVAKFILVAAEIGGTYNLTDGYNPTFNELSKNIANQIGKPFVPNLPRFIGLILAKFGDLLGNKFPINSDKFLKITSTLTFDDTKARLAFGWNPNPVLKNFKICKDV